MKTIKTFTLLALTLLLITSCETESNDETPEEMFTVGVVNPSPVLNSFFEDYSSAMATFGYNEGQNLEVLVAGPPDNLLEALALPNEFVDVELDLLVVFSVELALVSRSTLPDVDIVFIGTADPVSPELLEDLTQPENNVTGVLAQDVSQRRLQLLLEIVPDLTWIVVPYDTTDTQIEGSLEAVREAADRFGVKLLEFPMANSRDFPEVIESIPDNSQAIFLLQDELQVLLMQGWESFAREQELILVVPGTASPDDFEDNAYLMGYGLSLADAAGQVARLSSQILEGTSPGDLPVENSEIRFFVDLDIAESLGVEVPDTVLSQADFVIRSANTESDTTDE